MALFMLIAPGKALTWMDAVVHGTPVTARRGYDVEINALWYNAVCFSLEMAAKGTIRRLLRNIRNCRSLLRNHSLIYFGMKKLAIWLIMLMMMKGKYFYKAEYGNSCFDAVFNA